MKRRINKKTIPYNSLIRRFNVLFIFSSLIPFLILFYFYVQIVNFGKIDFSQGKIVYILLVVGGVTLFCFLLERHFLFKLHLLVQSLKSSMYKSFNKEMVRELTKGKGEIAELARAFGEIMNKLEENIKELQETKKKLYDIVSKVGEALGSVENFNILLNLILETVVGALGAEKGLIFGIEEAGPDSLELRAKFGFQGVSEEKIKEASASFIDWVWKEKKTLSIPSLNKEESRKKLLFPPLVCTPFLFHDKLWGAILLAGKQGKGNFTEDELKIISNLSYQIAIAFENVKLHRDIEGTYFETISALALAVEARDRYSRGHSERVGKYAIKIGKALGLSEKEISTLRDAAKLHDIGKIGIGDSVLNKPGSLSVEERNLMDKHPLIGESIVKPLKTFQHLLEPIRHHHECLDGSGYPDGLSGEEIPLITRILTVADVYDALTTDRPYRKAMTSQEAKEILWELVEKKKLDSGVVETICRLIDEGRL